MRSMRQLKLILTLFFLSNFLSPWLLAQESLYKLSWAPKDNTMVAYISVNNILGAAPQVSALQQIISQYRIMYPGDFDETIGSIGGYSPYSIFTATLLEAEENINVKAVQSFDLGVQSYLAVELFQGFNRIRVSRYQSRAIILQGDAAQGLFSIMKKIGVKIQEGDGAFPSQKIEMFSFNGYNLRAYGLATGNITPFENDIRCGYIEGGLFGNPTEYFCIIAETSKK